jgi:3-oxoacyl-[acyl-carrier-protein] synthase II
MKGRAAAVTGMGMVTPLGPDLAENLAGVKAGRTGIALLEGSGDWPERLRYAGRAGELPPLGDIGRKLTSQMKFLNRGSALGFHSAREAVEGSGIDLGEVSPERRALYVASGDFTNIDHSFLYPAIKDATGGKWEDVDQAKLNASTLAKVNPFFLLESIANNLFSFLSAFYGFMGPNTSIASLSPCGSNAVELAARAVAQGRADAALAVGCGSWINEVSLLELDGLGVLSRSEEGPSSFRPLDARRDGFVPGEGGAALLLEDEERARARGARILGRVTGLGNRIEHTGGRGFAIPERVNARSIEEALKDAGLAPGELSLVVAHGSATQRGDRSELGSIAAVLKDSAGRTPLCALKPYTGHMGAASDVAEIVFGLEALASGLAPGTPNFESADEEFRGMRISAAEQPCGGGGGNLLSISYGVGGQSSTVVVEAG